MMMMTVVVVVVVVAMAIAFDGDDFDVPFVDPLVLPILPRFGL